MTAPHDGRSPREESESLHARARAFVRAFERGEGMPESFDALACDLARFQAARVEGYARLCRVRGVDVRALTRAQDAPAVPAEAFKLSRVFAFADDEARVTFRTSGTTMGARGAHLLRDPGSYDAAALAFGRWALAPDLTSPVPVYVLAPSPEEAPDSSLSHMLALFARTFGTHAKPYFVHDGVLDVAALDEHAARALMGGVETAIVLGTSFAFVHLLDALGDNVFRLPPKSRVMQTGGVKGRSREVDARTLREDLARAFAIDPRSIVGEYGMTELSSQFYEDTIRDPSAQSGVYVEPPWARVIPVDPETLAPVPDGEIGIARVEDLMNVDSAFAIVTADRVRRAGARGFELLGRVADSPARGCSIAIDEILGASSNGGGG